MDLKLEALVLPVSDVDRAKRFYQKMGFRLDADYANEDYRIIQFTPPGSGASILFCKGNHFRQARLGRWRGTGGI